MYVKPEVRRRGVARRLLTGLEAWASGFGYRFLRLETGVRQPEAITLYESGGFQRIPPFGCHVGDPLSICFEKAVLPPWPFDPSEFVSESARQECLASLLREESAH